MGLQRSLRLLGLLLLGLCPACAALDVEPTGPASGKYTSTAISFTILAFDLPSPALEMARNNAADIGQPNILVERETVFPYLGRLDWILDILCIRFAKVTGTWGYPDDPAVTE